MDHKRRSKILILPFSLWFAFLVAGPFLLIFITSFLTRNEFGQLEFTLSLSAYRQLFDPLYLEVLLRTALMALTNTLACLLLAYPFAFYISRLPKASANKVIALVMIPFWTNYLLRVLAFMDVLRLEFFGITWVYTYPGMLLAMIYNYLPFALLPLYSTLEKIDSSLIEAAFDLGASRRQIFSRVLWPLSKVGVYTAALLVFIPSLGEFLIPTIVGGGQNFFLGTFLEHQFLTAHNWPLGSAAIVFLIMLSLFFLRFVKSSTQERYV